MTETWLETSEMLCCRRAGGHLCTCGLLLFALGCGRSTADLAAEAKGPDVRKRLHAVHALQGRAGEAEAVVPALTEALQDADTYVRRDAARALGTFGAAA